MCLYFIYVKRVRVEGLVNNKRTKKTRILNKTTSLLHFGERVHVEGLVVLHLHGVAEARQTHALDVPLGVRAFQVLQVLGELCPYRSCNKTTQNNSRDSGIKQWSRGKLATLCSMPRRLARYRRWSVGIAVHDDNDWGGG